MTDDLCMGFSEKAVACSTCCRSTNSPVGDPGQNDTDDLMVLKGNVLCLWLKRHHGSRLAYSSNHQGVHCMLNRRGHNGSQGVKMCCRNQGADGLDSICRGTTKPAAETVSGSCCGIGSNSRNFYDLAKLSSDLQPSPEIPSSEYATGRGKLRSPGRAPMGPGIPGGGWLDWRKVSTQWVRRKDSLQGFLTGVARAGCLSGFHMVLTSFLSAVLWPSSISSSAATTSKNNTES